MIFVTVGTQLPFDRLIQMVDSWAGLNPGEPVFMQTGQSTRRPVHCEATAFTSPDEWENHFRRADRVISHAGMGTILKSLTHGKPLIIMPRDAQLGEHRNDHQRATAERFASFDGIWTVSDERELTRALQASSDASGPARAGMSDGLETLISELRSFARDLR